MSHSDFQAITVTLNPAVDRTVVIPGFTAGAVNRVSSSTDRPGGKGVNVARTLANLGHTTAATGFLGRENSTLFEEEFRQRGICDYFVRVTGATRVGIKIVDPVLGQTTDVNFPGLCPQAAQIEQFSVGMKQLQAPWCVLSGSLPEGVEITFYRDLTRQLRARGIRVMMDTSGAPLRHALEAVPTAIKPNIHELSELLGTSLQTREEVLNAAASLLQRGIELVVISMGAEGALFVDKDQAITVKPPAIQVHSTVGAGDAMVAGTVAGAIRGLSISDQARLATACSVHVLIQRPAEDFKNGSLSETISRITLH